ncbi:MAG TPA: hypothetical protein DIC56_00835 [Rhizobium sp.]|nr:hypothetical protein [Rhizobium sp.]
MNAVAIGPFAFDAERFTAVIGVVAFLFFSAFLAHRVDDRLGRWSTSTALAGLAGARLFHVASHIQSFLGEPWRVLALWQGGFSWFGGVAGVAVMLLVLFIRNRPVFPWAALSVVVGASAALSTAMLTLESETRLAPPPAGFPALSGNSVSIGSSGRPSVVNLWATWCPPCRRELPMMAEMATATPGVDFVFINQGEGSAAVEAYLRRQGLTLSDVVLDPSLQLSGHYNAPGLPATLFLNADGILVGSHLGEISREVLAEEIVKLQIPSTRNE